jgi:hypothetical protein
MDKALFRLGFFSSLRFFSGPGRGFRATLLSRGFRSGFCFFFFGSGLFAFLRFGAVRGRAGRGDDFGSFEGLS